VIVRLRLPIDGFGLHQRAPEHYASPGGNRRGFFAFPYGPFRFRSKAHLGSGGRPGPIGRSQFAGASLCLSTSAAWRKPTTIFSKGKLLAAKLCRLSDVRAGMEGPMNKFVTRLSIELRRSDKICFGCLPKKRPSWRRSRRAKREAARLERVPPHSNRGDSARARGRRVYRH